MAEFSETFTDYNIATMLKADVSAVRSHCEMDMKIEDLLLAVKFMLKTNEPPQMIVFQCGEHNVCVGRNVDIVEVMKRDLSAIRQEIPGVVLVWSQMLPPWMAKSHTGGSLAKSRRRINRFMMQCFVSEEVGGAFLYHPLLRTNLKNKYHMRTSDGFLHLNKCGMKEYIYQLQVGIRYFLTGHGSIFPYMKWPLNRPELASIVPECMCMLNKEQIQSLNYKKFSAFSVEQIQALSNDQLLMFTKNQSPFVYSEDLVQKLSPKQLGGLTKKNFMFLSNRQMRFFENEKRFSFISKEIQDFISRKMKARKSGVKNRKNRFAELKDEAAEVEEEKKEWKVGDMIASSEDEVEQVNVSGSDTGSDDSVVSERDWALGERDWVLGERDWELGERWSGALGYEKRYRSCKDREGRGECRESSRSCSILSESRDKGLSNREINRNRSRSRERYRSHSSDSDQSSRGRRSQRESGRRQSVSNERNMSEPRSSDNIPHDPAHVPYPGPHHPGMASPFVFPPHRMPPGASFQLPYQVLGPRPPFTLPLFPGVWPGAPIMLPGPPPAGAPTAVATRSKCVENWGDGPVEQEYSSVNTNNLTLIK